MQGQPKDIGTGIYDRSIGVDQVESSVASNRIFSHIFAVKFTDTVYPVSFGAGNNVGTSQRRGRVNLPDIAQNIQRMIYNHAIHTYIYTIIYTVYI